MYKILFRITSLNSALTQHTIGSPRSLTSTEWTATSDGYVVAGVGYTTGQYVYVDVNDIHLLQVVSGGVGGSAMAGFQTHSIFVKKGMKLKVRQISGNDAYAYFYPLS